MKRLLWFSVLIFLCTAATFSQAQTKQVKGKITNESGVGLPGASVLLTGTQKGVQSDNDGNFTISVPDDNKKHSLIISYVGYASQTVSIDGNAVSVKLKQESKENDDVVVIGYQTKRRVDVLAPVASITAKDLKDVPLNSAEQALAGRLAGVQVTTSEGSPDASVKIVVRGGMSITQDNSPLYIVDGVPIDNALSALSPQDIQSIDVLKDASATAIYGARGANGVVIITTKSGKPGKTILQYNGSVGMKNLTKELPVLQPYDFINFQYEASRWGRYIGNVNGTAESNFNNNWGSYWDTLLNYKKVPNVDWQNIMMGQTGILQNHNVIASGGNKNTTYNLSLTNNQDQGIVLNSGYNRNIASLKIDSKITDKLKIGVSGRYTNQLVTGSGTSDPGSTAYNRLRQSVRYKPILTAGQTIDTYDLAYAAETNSNSLTLLNPVLLDKGEVRRRTTTVTNFTGYLSYAISKHFSFRSTFGYDDNSYEEKFFEDTITPDARLNGSGKPIYQLTTTDRRTWSNSNVITFNYKFGSHHVLDGVVGQEFTQVKTEGLINRLGQYAAGISATPVFAGTVIGTSFASYPQLTTVEARRLSMFGRINYAYDNKYLISFTLRQDGSSKFAEPNRWSSFPSASVGWRLSQEKFMRDLNFITDLKLRAGYGETGNDRINDYLYITQFLQTSVYGLNNGSTIGYLPAALSNPYLKWESNITRNFGFDAAFFKNRLTLTFDIYKNTAQNLLIAAPVPTTSGYTSQLQNIGAATNKGVEIAIGSTLIQKKDFTWSVNFNIAFNKNTIDNLATRQNFYYDNSGALTGQTADYIVKVGQPVGSMFGYVTDGMYQVSDFNATYNSTLGQYTYTLKSGVPSNAGIVGTVYPGTLKFKDINGDGVVDANDRTIIGNANPKFTGGMNQTFMYKNFDASIFVNFVYGNNILNANKIEFTNAFTPDANVLSLEKDRWRFTDPTNGQLVTEPNALAALNANAKVWIPSQTTGAGAFVLHSWAVEDGSFLRVNNISIGYTVPSKTLRRYNISKLRFYFTVNNLATLTNYSGYDPEVNARRTTPTTPGVDYSAYPRARTFLFGMNLTL